MTSPEELARAINVLVAAVEAARAVERARGSFDLSTHRGFAAFIVAQRDAREAMKKLKEEILEEP